MTEDAGTQLALQDYRTKWLTAWTARVWTTDLAALWQAEYAKISAGAFDPTFITSAAFEGGNASSVKGFEQTVRLSGLQKFRCDLDETYRAIFGPPLAPPARKRSGFVLQLHA